MAHPLNYAIERALKEAEAADDFKDLPGAGKPLAFLSTPGDAVLDRLMKENQAKPRAVILKARIAEVQQALKVEADPETRKRLMGELADQQLRLNLELEALRKYG